MIGRLDQIGELFKIKRVSNGRGGSVTRTESLGRVWFGYADLGLDKILEYEQFQTKATGTIHMRYDDRISPDCFIVTDKHKYTFTKPKEIGNQQFLSIVATKEELFHADKGN